MRRHTIHLSLICMSFAQRFQYSSYHTALTFLRAAVYAKGSQPMNKCASSCVFIRWVTLAYTAMRRKVSAVC
jgi:hypothetical protein